MGRTGDWALHALAKSPWTITSLSDSNHFPAGEGRLRQIPAHRASESAQAGAELCNRSVTQLPRFAAYRGTDFGFAGWVMGFPGLHTAASLLPLALLLARPSATAPAH